MALLVVGGSRVHAQASVDTSGTDTTLVAEPVEVVATRLRRLPVGGAGRAWSPEELRATGATSLAELLDRAAGAHVRTYGPGALASLSVRGGSAAHTLALWNGLPLASPTLGQLDWSLLPVGAGADQRVTLSRGGNAALWGSGAVAATVSVDDIAPAGEGLGGTVALAAGAFGERGGDARLAYGAGCWLSVTSLSAREADNDFAYRPAPELPTRRQTNAALQQTHLRQNLYFRPGPGDELAAHYWRARTDREIPPTLVQNRSEARQADRADRLALRWRHVRRRYTLAATGGYFAEGLDFADPRAGVDSRSAYTVALADATVDFPLAAGHALRVGVSASDTRANVDDAYDGRPRELRAAALASYTLSRKRWDLQVSARQGLVDGRALPLTPGLGLAYRATPSVTLRARAGRDYRLPTFNDRYWRPGGNPDLRAEAGWSQEVGADFESGGWTAAFTGFHRTLRDWILWARPEGASYWSAYNLAAVRSVGLELRLGYARDLGAHTRLSLSGGYDYVRAANRVAIEQPTIARGQQLWYVPRHAGFAAAALARGGWRLAYYHRWRGRAAGINADVEASSTGDLRLGYTHTRGRRRLDAFAELRNLTDDSYQLIERRPLPGRHVRFGVTIDFRQAANYLEQSPRTHNSTSP